THRDRRDAEHQPATADRARVSGRDAGGLSTARRAGGSGMTPAANDTDFRYIAHKMPYLPAEGRNGKLIVIEGTDGSGRSTQAYMLKQWLEVQGYAVMDTGWTRSKLIGQAITDAKQGHSLHRLTYCLMYATDLADRLEYQILP